MATFSMMFMHWALAVDAAANLKKEGTTIVDNRKVVRKNPNLQAFRDNSLAYLRYSSLFGLDPSSRTTISVEEPIDENDPMEQILRKVDEEMRRK